ncbi:MAG: response regulator transcription factor, partial [Candidatus Dormibacter sp.]|uniref:helix-turn-helix transcriptional regulator n=1 Tax=Candidatus Dormibacter sp. TaxID=2973982 RepID=UPI003D9B2362
LDTMRDLAEEGFDHTAATSLRINLALARGDVAPALAAARDVIATDQLPSHNCDLATATGAAYAWAGQADDARRILRYSAERAVAEQFPAAHVLALVHLAIVELDDGASARAQTAACTAADTARDVGLGAYHGVATAYAVRARTTADPARAHADALLAVSLAKRASTDLALGYVLAVCGDTLTDLGDPAGLPLITEARSVLGQCPDPGIAGRYLSRTESRHGVAERSRTPVAALVEHLTERELAVLRYLPASEMSQRDIASELYLSLNAVKTHCKAIYHKLGVVDRKAAVQAARDVHLL